MAKKQFKAESKRLLDLMVNSIYTHKEIFLRELISNASDAEDKLAYKSLTDDTVEVKRKDLKITIVPDKQMRTLTISDNGIGMSKEDLESNLGTIARSGRTGRRRQGRGQDRRYRPVRRGLLLRLHGGRSGHRYLPCLGERGGLDVAV